MQESTRSTGTGYELPGWKQRLLKWLGLAAGGVLALIIALSLLQCSLKKPEAPTWESNLRIPVGADHLDIANLLRRLDGGEQFVDSLGNVGLFFADTLDTVALGADLTIPPQVLTVPEGLGQLRVPPPTTGSAREVLSEWFPGPGSSVPPFDLIDLDTIGPLPQYTWIVAASGEAWLRIENEFGLDFDSVTVWLNDVVAGPLGVYDFPGGIPAGSADSLPIGIAGRQLFNRFGYQLYAHTPGGTIDTTLALSSYYLDVSLPFHDSLVIDSGLLEVPAVVRAQSRNVGFTGNSDVIAIRSADLASGSLDLTLDNRTSLTSGVTVSIPSFTSGGTGLTRNIALSPGATQNVQIDLSGYTWVPEAPNAPQYFVVDVTAATVASAPQHVLVRATDSVVVTAALGNLNANRLTGVLAPRQVALPSFQQDVTVPGEMQAFHPAEALLQLDIVNGTGAGALLDFLLTADNGRSLQVSGAAIGGAPAVPVTSQIQEPNLATLLDPYPSRIDVNGTATFGDSVTEYTIAATDWALASVTISAPLAVRIDTVTFASTTDNQPIVGTDVNEITDDLLGGVLRVEAGNHLPIGADLTLFVSTDSTQVYNAPEIQLGPVTLSAGTTDLNGVVSDVTRASHELSLTSDQLQIVDAGRIFMGYRIFLHGSGGQVVRVTGADYLDLTAWFDVTLRNNKDTW